LPRIVLCSDLHSAPDALLALIDETSREGVFEIWCLGDIVGYGPYPMQMIRLVQTLQHDQAHASRASMVLQGNHDHGVGSGADLIRFDLDAQRIVGRQRAALPDDALRWLADLPLHAMPLDGYCLAHGSFEPDAESEYARLWVYSTQTHTKIRVQWAAANAFCSAQGVPLRVIAVGHYHVPGLWQITDQGDMINNYPPWGQASHSFDNLHRGTVVINPGSIALPREGAAHPVPSYVLLDIADDLDSLTVSFRCLKWDSSDTIAQIGADYPPILRAQLHRQLSLVCPP